MLKTDVEWKIQSCWHSKSYWISCRIKHLMYWEKILLTPYAVKTLCLTFCVWTETSTTTAPLESGHYSQWSVWKARIKSNTLKSFNVLKLAMRKPLEAKDLHYKQSQKINFNGAVLTSFWWKGILASKFTDLSF